MSYNFLTGPNNPHYHNRVDGRYPVSPVLLSFFIFLNFSVYSLDKSDYYEAFHDITDRESWDEGERLYRRAVTEYPDELVFHCYLNEMLRKEKKVSEALRQITPVFRDHPDSKYIRNSYKWSLIDYALKEREENRPDEALSFLRRALETEPDDLSAMLWYGILLRETGDLDGSIEVLERGELLHDNHYITGNLVQSYVEKANAIREDDPAKARELYTKALTLDPDNLTPLLWYGIFSRERKQYKTALEYLERALRMYPENKYLLPNINHTYFEYGKHLTEIGDDEAAIKVYEEAVKRFPENLYYYYYLFTFYLERDLLETAEDVLLRWCRAKAASGLAGEELFKEENNISYRIDDLNMKYIIGGNVNAAFSLIQKAKPYFTYQHLILNREGELRWHNGEIAEGISLINKAYDIYIKDYPEYKRPVVIDLPMKGTFVVAGGNNSTRAMTHAGLARFCFDFMGSDEKGNTKREGVEGMGRNEDYYGFGMSIYSPVNGTVVEVNDDGIDHPPTNKWMYHLSGNNITIRGRDGYKYVFVHNKHGTAKVSPGDTVGRGQKIAELGNTSSSIPHLHFGVWTEDWTVSIPVQFREYTELMKDGTTVKRTLTTPPEGTVIRVEGGD